MSILIVEDNRTVGSVMRRILEKASIGEVALVTSAEAAVLRLEEEAFRLFIVDRNLPGSSGIDLIRHLRSRDAYRQAPIIMITGQSQVEDVLEAVEAGADDYLVKPMSWNVLLNKVKKLLERKSSEFGVREF